jgi:hypothetical protein
MYDRVTPIKENIPVLNDAMVPAPSIKVVLDKQYGQSVVKPADENAQLFCELIGTKTLTPSKIALIKKLGYKIEVVPTEPKEL